MPDNAESVVVLEAQLAEARQRMVEAVDAKDKAVRAFNRLYDAVTIAKMRARNDGADNG